MKIFKYFFFLLLIIAIGGSVYIATLDGDYQVEKTLVIAAPEEMIFEEVNELKNWEAWDPWLEKDEEMVFSYPSTSKGEGAIRIWQGDQLPDGRLETLESIPYATINQKRMTEIPVGEVQQNVYWKFEPLEDSTKVTWGIKGNLSFYEKGYNALKNISYQDQLAPKLEKGLENLAATLTEKMKVFSVKVDGITAHSGGYYMYTTSASRDTNNAILSRKDEMLKEVKRFMENNALTSKGDPLLVYNQTDNENGTVIISAGYPTENKITTPEDSRILIGFLESQAVLKVTLKGHTSNLPLARIEAENYIVEEDLMQNEDAEVFEVFAVEKEQDPNPANWLTHIYIPLEEKPANEEIITENENLY